MYVRARQKFIVLRNEGNEIVLGFISKLCFTYVGSNLKSSCLRVDREKEKEIDREFKLQLHLFTLFIIFCGWLVF